MKNIKNIAKNSFNRIKKYTRNIVNAFKPKNLFELSKYEFDKIFLEESVVMDIIDFAKNLHPKEFVAFLEGEFKDNRMTITSLIYHKFMPTERSAIFRLDYPTGMNLVGTVHSHPSPNNRPSGADLRLYNKFGGMHMIISHPYSARNIEVYDYKGNSIHVEILRN
jgi:proteasome lid subunit RPN8/RPN11